MKNRMTQKMSTAILFLFIILFTYLPTTVHAAQTTRIAGANRYETSVSISRHVYGSSQTVVLVSGQSFPDALSAGPLASKLRAPLLLVEAGRVPSAVVQEVQRLNARNVIVVGGESVISTAAVQSAFPRLNVRRIAGQNRYETSMRIAHEMKATKAGIVNGLNFPDGLAAGAFMAKQGMALVLSNGTSVPYSPTNTSYPYLFGGTSVNALPGYSGTRLHGDNRYLTALSIAKSGFPNARTVILASGTNYPDALSAISLSVKYDAPIVLTSGQSVPKDVVDYMRGKQVIVVGGTNAVSDAHVQSILNPPKPPSKPAPKQEEKPSQPAYIDGYPVMKTREEAVQYIRHQVATQYPAEIKFYFAHRKNGESRALFFNSALSETYNGKITSLATIYRYNQEAFHRYELRYDVNASQRKAVDDSARALASSLKSRHKGAREQIKAAFDYIVQNYRYDYDYKIYDPYNFITHKKGVCNAYSTYFGRVLEWMGFDVRYISGMASYEPGGSAGFHAWNEVKVDGQWYTIDSTWGSYSNSSAINYRYFMMDAKQAVNTHKK